jgi:hypothetical protein
MFDRKRPWIQFLSSLEVAIAALAFLMVLVVMCTLDQVKLGMWASVEKYFRSAFIYWYPGGGGFKVPIFPAGGAVGALLFLNVVASMFARVRRDWSKSGIWLIHIGLVMLVFGEFVTGMFAIETQMAIDEGKSANYAVSNRKSELVVVDLSVRSHETVYAMRTDSIRRGKILSHKDWPFRLRISEFYPNADAGARPDAPNIPPSPATQGVGRSMLVKKLPVWTRDDRRDLPAAYVEVLESGSSKGTWLAWAGLNGVQVFAVAGKPYALQMRPLRRYMPFTMTLKDFTHERYPGTNIPKNFQSTVRLQNLQTGEDREVLIYMNHPLRYMGRTFFQASYGKNDTMSVFQVVENPGWLLPYISFVLMAIGLCVHFGLMLAKFKPTEVKGS